METPRTSSKHCQACKQAAPLTVGVQCRSVCVCHGPELALDVATVLPLTLTQKELLGQLTFGVNAAAATGALAFVQRPVSGAVLVHTWPL